MGLIVDGSQVLEIEMGVDLGGGEMGMSQHFLNGAEIMAGLQQV